MTNCPLTFTGLVVTGDQMIGGVRLSVCFKTNPVEVVGQATLTWSFWRVRVRVGGTGTALVTLKLVAPTVWLQSGSTLIGPPMGLLKENSGDLPARMSPAFQAFLASAQVEYNPLELSQTTISNVACGASGAMLLKVAVAGTILPEAEPVRKVVVVIPPYPSSPGCIAESSAATP